ncbi:molybdopterin molybdotransferase MoeA [Acetobacter orleanensis]|uniref:Molybdopterin molybdenumtransferase n=1 Tax=Acetobacter orleanensis TaxID=104099 RepID=A0A4Y3TT65_9PROT|nr:molybdopterin molybdotransferase MoeA [Acetobacter orleanensis]KXV66875.1 molybdopterin biosynthesis protein MoeA [Acetobacter orleanensis]PCD78396.1 molybdopterin molybdenumtransferase MoeA [Acetobacter orleanensis]GAN69344.1 molybdopterin biosynthesis protein MoeA [Acetobacter orleanensis JCM 7639]GEB83965.1 molybdopterin molybdenumtransferase MoeA [Acetobacter orleanensis]
MRNSFTSMVDCDTALQLIAAYAEGASVRPLMHVPLAEAVGRITAHDVRAVSARPEADISAMDGYAFSHAAMQATEAGLPVVGQMAAGDLPVPLPVGQALGILTGARIPQGADCVMAKERMYLTETGLVQPAKMLAECGANIRRAGEEFPQGAMLVTRGTRLDWRHTALLACQGITEVAVIRPVRVAVVSNGAELAEDASDTRADSNSPMLAALLREAGAEVVLYSVPSDDEQKLSETLAQAWAETDVLVTTGGISVGQTDNVMDALRSLGAETVFRGVTIRPGKPLTVMAQGKRLAFCLPGNPGASAICALVFLLPYVRTMMGMVASTSQVPGITDFAFTPVAGTTHFIPVSFKIEPQGLRLSAVPTVGASDIIVFSRASALLRIDPDYPVEAGQTRWVLPF